MNRSQDEAVMAEILDTVKNWALQV